MVILIIIFFAQLLLILDYLYHPKDSQYPRTTLKIAKLCYLSTICMLGGFAAQLIISLFYGYVGGGSGGGDIYGRFGIRNFNSIFKIGLKIDFFYGYFITLLIIFLNNIKNIFK